MSICISFCLILVSYYHCTVLIVITSLGSSVVVFKEKHFKKDIGSLPFLVRCLWDSSHKNEELIETFFPTDI